MPSRDISSAIATVATASRAAAAAGRAELRLGGPRGGRGGGARAAARRRGGERRREHPARYSSQSLSRSFFGRYSSVMKLMPRRESASSSNLRPLRTISWISRCQRACLNQG